MFELSETRIFEFQGFRLNAKSQRLYCRDSAELVPLTPKAVELLIALVQNKGRVVSKKELLDTVWGDSFVEEANLSQTIFVLRKALGDDRKEPRFILTAPNRGYQFIAEIVEMNLEDKILEANLISETEPFLPARDRSSGRARSTLWLLVPVVLLMFVGAYFLYPRSGPSDAAKVRTIAVLPFEDLSSEQGERYLGISLADELANRFGNLKEITVRPTRSVMQYAGSTTNPGAIGRELRVDAVLDGRIQRVGDRIRVSVQLVRSSDDRVIWTGRFDDAFTNIFAVQDSISKMVVQSISLQLDKTERARFDDHGTKNVAAYQDFLRARYFWNKRTRADLLKSIEYYDQAIAADPAFAEAYAGLADCYILLPEYGATVPGDAFPKAEAAVLRSLELDDQSAQAYAALGYSQAFYDWNWSGAERSFVHSIELNPNYSTAHQWYAELLFVLGRFDDARTHYEKALRIDPVSSIILTDLSSEYYFERKYDLAIQYSKRAIEIDPNFAYGYFYLGFSYERQGRFQEASDALARTMDLFGEPPECSREVRHAFEKNGMVGWWLKRKEQFETKPHLKYFPAYSKAFIYARVGDKERAIEWLAKSFDLRERFTAGTRLDPAFETLRDDSRFKELVTRLGMPIIAGSP